jgi:DNA repair protein RecN (Recombination protein N)
VALGDADGCDTLVFDEVDAGVGGATAVALAQVLRDLGRTHQDIVVTHLAQVAVMADRHYLVHKVTLAAGEPPETKIDEVTGEARVAEVARMLSGDTGEASLAHAREMLEHAGNSYGGDSDGTR